MDLEQQTVKDFSDQWTHYVDNRGFWGSLEFLKDLFGPLLILDDIRGKRVADIGSGTGRTVKMLLDAGVVHVIAVEPSKGACALRENLRHEADRVTVLEATGEALPGGLDLDYAISIGVIHHIPDPGPTLRAVYSALKPGGRLLIWVYGEEGNGAYLRFLRPLRLMTTHLPHSWLRLLSWFASLMTPIYLFGCRLFPLPFREYARNVFANLPLAKRELVIYDQLNPAYAKYYSQAEVTRLLESAGFSKIRLYHRHGCSWTALGEKPCNASNAGL